MDTARLLEYKTELVKLQAPNVEQSVIDAGLDVLRMLQQSTVTAGMLRETKCGVLLTGLSKASHLPEEVRGLCRTVVQQWKAHLQKTGQVQPSAVSAMKRADSELKRADSSASGKGGATGEAAPAPRPSSDSSLPSMPHAASTASSALPRPVSASSPPPSGSPSSPSGAEARTLTEAEARLGKTGDPARNKIQQLLYEALDPRGGELQADVAIQLENALWSKWGSDRKQYNARFRDIVQNLKDESNPELNDNLLDGRISPEELVTMDSKDMASSELKKERAADAKWMRDAARSDWNKVGRRVFLLPPSQGQ